MGLRRLPDVVQEILSSGILGARDREHPVQARQDALELELLAGELSNR